MMRGNRTYVSCVALVLCLCMDGCAGRGQYNPSTGAYNRDAFASEFVVTAERLRATALEVFGALMEIERTHEAEFRKVNPGIHSFTEDVRAHGAEWLNALTAAKSAYQSERTPEKLTALNLQMAIVNTAVAHANRYLTPGGGGK